MTFKAKDIFNFSLVFFVAVSSLFYIGLSPEFKGDPVVYSYQLQELFFRYGVIAVFLISLFCDPVRKADLKYPAIFLLYVILLSIFLGFSEVHRRVIWNVSLAILFMKTVIEHYDIKNHGYYVRALMAILILNYGMAFMQFLQKDPLFTHINADLIPYSEPIGFMRIKAHLGTIAAIIAPVCASVSGYFILLAIPLIWWSQSSAAAVTLVIGIIMLSRHRKVLAPLFIAAAAAYVYFYDAPGGQFGERFHVWFSAFSMTLKQSPFFGLGAGAWASSNMHTIQQNGQPIGWVWVHNEYIQAFFEFGFIGVFILYKFVSGIFRDYHNRVKMHNWEVRGLFVGFVSILLVSVIHFPFHLARLAVPCLFIMSALIAFLTHLKPVYREESHEKNSSRLNSCPVCV